ncbi:MAG: response regulator [Silicimonas sp.]|nr:response regulator [Silicimonas sp.]
MTSDLLTGMTVLLVEDDLRILGQLETLLNTLGYREIRFSPNLEDARRLAQAAPLDVALLGVNLGSGIQTVQLGRDLARRGVCTLFMSGFNAEDMARATRGFEFLEKPLSLPRLKSALNRAFLRQDAVTREPVALGAA